jgi:tRNA (uracil-5-)-methyltransferase TRM9
MGRVVSRGRVNGTAARRITSMNAETIQRLNAINRNFYRTTADEFDATRGQAWSGWKMLLPHLSTPLRVLDVGCGNGRFGAFLAESLPGEIQYHGVDNSAALLAHARTDLAAYTHLTTTLTELDIIEQPLPDGMYDLVTLFGVLHHVPGAAQRQTFMQSLSERVARQGLLVFAAWRFYDYDRFRQRIVAWEAYNAEVMPSERIDRDELEAGDWLLDWRRGERAFRYCHAVDDAEHARLIQATGLTEVQTYRADGFSDAMNQYSIVRRG